MEKMNEMGAFLWDVMNVMNGEQLEKLLKLFPSVKDCVQADPMLQDVIRERIESSRILARLSESDLYDLEDYTRNEYSLVGEADLCMAIEELRTATNSGYRELLESIREAERSIA